ncbi:unnamed protein product [Microthlaspi erraticum]|uniref:Uncharacterized protein n=1 Tax=Microthlaspi erraticum TaxID=1685480 RepID=A0A6D2JNW3_9BRAS|nr:unnamed protein product [Microthlaspi erraticum]
MADGFCRGRAIWSAKLFWPRDFGRGRSFVSRIDRHGRSVPIRKFRPIAAVFPGSRVRERFVAQVDDPAEHGLFLPGSTVTVGQIGIARPKSLLRVRGQCFGADCVFTPFSPSILS